MTNTALGVQRIADANVLRLIRRFLKAGILEDGVFSATVEGRRHFPAARIVHNLYPTPPWMTQTGSRMV